MKLSLLPPTLPAIELAPEKTDAVVSTKPQQTQPIQWFKQGSLAVFTSTFLTIFFSEMGDKTQIATLLMAAESHSPWLVFAGASSALVLTSLLGVLLGRWLANRISPQVLQKAAGVSMLLIAAQLLWEILWQNG